ncbi:MAG: SGNH/GDSL hydrolase family protein [Flavobacteriales bacterium]|nr:SGNH/GDSL hydrolase family protein [Flavobacteriales bacterium]MBP6696932.1 SGNH/GDSL hydrolase family protein [Flavobacteriales bacterium]
MEDQPSLSKRRWGRVAYVLFLTVFTFSCVEIGARYYLGHVLQKASDNKFRFNHYRVYEHVPGFHEGDGKEDWIVINANGFRRREDVPVKKPAGTIRIFFMGGSAAHGISSASPYPIVHVRMDETVDAHLERILRTSIPGQRVEVINAAVTGYHVFQHTEYLMSELLAYDPDMVIFFDGANDHYINNPDYRYMTDLRHQFWKPLLQEPSMRSVWFQFAFWMAKCSGAFRGYVSWWMTMEAQREMERVDLIRWDLGPAASIAAHRTAAHDQFLRAIETNLFLLRREGVKAVLCLQPMLVLRDTTLLSSAERAFLRRDVNVQTLYPTVIEELRGVATKWNVPLVDMNPSFNNPAFKGQQLLIDYCHLNSAGGEVCARTLAPVVQHALATPPLIPSAEDTLPVTALAAPGT